jgi:hypothetical protein
VAGVSQDLLQWWWRKGRRVEEREEGGGAHVRVSVGDVVGFCRSG